MERPNPRPRLGEKVFVDGDMEGRVRGYATERSVVVELKKGFWGDKDSHSYARGNPMSANIFLSSILVHASNLKDADGNRRWALPRELADV